LSSDRCDFGEGQHLPDNAVAGGDTVSIYAVDESDAAALMHNLLDFAPRLPKNVRQAGRYLE
jgi:hypothetical protein